MGAKISAGLSGWSIESQAIIEPATSTGKKVRNITTIKIPRWTQEPLLNDSKATPTSRPELIERSFKRNRFLLPMVAHPSNIKSASSSGASGSQNPNWGNSVCLRVPVETPFGFIA